MRTQFRESQTDLELPESRRFEMTLALCATRSTLHTRRVVGILGRQAPGEITMVTVGSVSREEAADRFEFLASRYPGRRNALKQFTHFAPEFVFWVFPGGRLFDARDAHRKNVPRGFEHILSDEPDYGGFLRGRVARSVHGAQLVVAYCRPEALAEAGTPLDQLLSGLSQLPVPLDHDALVVSDNADIYGTVADLERRQLAVTGARA